MIETVRCGLADRGLERGLRFIIATYFLDNMWIDLLFNRLGRYTQCILDRERSARSMGDDANAVHAEKRRAAVFLVVHPFFYRLKGLLGQERAGHPDLALYQLVLEPFENRVADRFAGFQNDIADKAVADDDLDRVREKIVALDVAAEVERAA